jgi:hypothetical protein
MFCIYHLILRQETRRLMIQFCEWGSACRRSVSLYPARNTSVINSPARPDTGCGAIKKDKQRHLPQNTIGSAGRSKAPDFRCNA